MDQRIERKRTNWGETILFYVKEKAITVCVAR